MMKIHRKLPPHFDPNYVYKHLPKIVHLVLAVNFLDLARILSSSACTFCLGHGYDWFASLGSENHIAVICAIIGIISVIGAVWDHRQVRLASIAMVTLALIIEAIGFDVGAHGTTAEASLIGLVALGLAEFYVETRR